MILAHKHTGYGVFLGKRHDMRWFAALAVDARIEQLFDKVASLGEGDPDDYVLLQETDESWDYAGEEGEWLIKVGFRK
jgi:hypothetical protein